MCQEQARVIAERDAARSETIELREALDALVRKITYYGRIGWLRDSQWPKEEMRAAIRALAVRPNKESEDGA
jgi:hypothetical protein